MKIEEQILRSLMEFYPLKVDEIVLISAVQKNIKDISIDQISETIRSLKDEESIEESLVMAPFGGAKTHRFKITPSGIEHLKLLWNGGTRNQSGPMTEIESRLVENYNQIRSDMAALRQKLEESRKELEGSIEQENNMIADLSKELLTVKELVSEYMGKTEEQKIREEHLILQILSGDERTIYDTVLKAGGEMLQKDLVARTKMSNAKVSRTVDHLESRGVLTKERYGATNRLRIVVKRPKHEPLITPFH